ncbi:hypothetical protein ACHAXR_012028 [Thalassiosira sp. AJA248-18]
MWGSRRFGITHFVIAYHWRASSFLPPLLRFAMVHLAVAKT